MKKFKPAKHFLSVFLAVILVLSVFPASAVQSIIASAQVSNGAVSRIVSEVTELREESVKHFLCEDGIYIAATYASPVHYEENGQCSVLCSVTKTIPLQHRTQYLNQTTAKQFQKSLERDSNNHYYIKRGVFV